MFVLLLLSFFMFSQEEKWWIWIKNITALLPVPGHMDKKYFKNLKRSSFFSTYNLSWFN